MGNSDGNLCTAWTPIREQIWSICASDHNMGNPGFGPQNAAIADSGELYMDFTTRLMQDMLRRARMTLECQRANVQQSQKVHYIVPV